MPGLVITPEVTMIGMLTGLSYALLAAGLVLMYRATRIINFAHGQIGAFAAALFLVLDENLHVPYALALLAALATGGATGILIELGVIRRLSKSSSLILLVATLGVSQILLFAQAVLPSIKHANSFPVPFQRTIPFGNMYLLPEHFLILALAPALIAGLGLLLSRTPFGRAVRATSENPESARLAGINTRRIGTAVWALAGLLSVMTAILVEPVRGQLANVPTAALGPSLLLRALAAGLVGRMTNLPITLAAGVGIGVVEAWLLSSFPTQPGLTDALLFLLVLALLLLRGQGTNVDEAGTAKLVARIRPIPIEVAKTPQVRAMKWGGMGGAGLLAALLPVFFSQTHQLFLLTQIFIYAIVGISITLLTGWSGQLSLGQFAFVGVGAIVTAAFCNRGMPFGVAVLYATVAGGFIALVVGIPALRIRGLFLAVTTLAFAVACSGYLLTLNVFVGSTTQAFVNPGPLGPINFANYHVYYYFCLVCLVGVSCTATWLRRSGVGRSLVAVRDNDRGAAAFTISPTASKLTAFVLAGAMAALAGALYAGLARRFTPTMFTPDLSLQALSMAIVGGLGSVAGAVIGAAYVVGIPSLFNDSVAATALTSGAGLLVLLMYLPGGLIGILASVRESVIGWALRSKPEPVATPELQGGLSAREIVGKELLRDRVDPEIPALLVRDISVSFGGRKALDGVTLEARQGEVVGLIGANGAGKTTLMNVISGFIPAEGSIHLLGQDITDLAPPDRASAGLGRAFQNARLFGGLTVLETLQAALEASERSEVVPCLFGLPPARRAEAAKLSTALELVHFLGLGRYRDTFIDQLSTGTRRVTELACLLAVQADVLLLDEPTAGVAQRETEAFGPLIKRIQQELAATVLIIEHDMPLVMSISDRVYCLETGRVLASGTPAEVRNNPAVIASYLGTDDRAILRSGTLSNRLRTSKAGKVASKA